MCATAILYLALGFVSIHWHWHAPNTNSSPWWHQSAIYRRHRLCSKIAITRHIATSLPPIHTHTYDAVAKVSSAKAILRTETIATQHGQFIRTQKYERELFFFLSVSRRKTFFRNKKTSRYSNRDNSYTAISSFAPTPIAQPIWSGPAHRAHENSVGINQPKKSNHSPNLQ